MAKTKNRKRDWVPGLFITWILLVLAGVLTLLLSSTKILPSRYLGAGLVVLVVLILVDWILLFRVSAKNRFTAGLLMSFVLLLALVFGIMYCVRTTHAINTVTGARQEVSRIGVYVRSDSAAQTVSDTQEATYGILETLDRENTDQARPQLTVEYGFVPEVMEYASMTELAGALYRGDVQVIVLNQAYLDLIADLEGYEDFKSMVRQIGFVDLTRKKAASKEKEESSASSPAFWGDKVYTLYISGVDAEGDVSAAGRSDVNIVATLNLDTKQMLLVSTPRDYFVPLSISDGQRDKLTHAGIYGVQVSMDTLGMLYDIDLDYYVRINFAGFVNIIDALGGITVWSDYEFDSNNILGYHFKQGENFMDGEAALVFSRERFAFEDGDRQRGKNQMAVIKGILSKMASLDMLANFGSVISGLSDCVSTNVPYLEIAKLLRTEIGNMAAWNVVTYSVDGTGDTQVPYSMSEPAYVMIPNEDTVQMARTLMQKVRDSELIEQ